MVETWRMMRTWERKNPGTLEKKPKEFTVLAPRRAGQFHLIGRIRIRIVTRWTDVQLAQLGFRAKSLVLTTLFVHRRVLDISIVVAPPRTQRTAARPGITSNFFNEAQWYLLCSGISEISRVPNVQGSKSVSS